MVIVVTTAELTGNQPKLIRQKVLYSVIIFSKFIELKSLKVKLMAI